MDVKPGYKQTEVGVIPQDWKISPLEEFTSFISYGFTNPMPTVETGVYMITARDINHGRIQFDTARRTTEQAYETLLTAKSRPKRGDLLLTKDGTLGRLALVDDRVACINQSVAILRPNAKVVPQFLKVLLEAPVYQSRMLVDAGGSTIRHIYITIVNRMPVAVPPTREEQQAIAEALSDGDALIESLGQLLAKKRQLKQGAMQELLTGKKRLPGFEVKPGHKQTDGGLIPEDWEVRSLDSIAFVTSGKRLPLGRSLTDHETPHPYIRVSDMRPGSVSLADIQFVPVEVFPSIKRYRIFSDDIFISVAGTLGIVGRIPVQLDGANLTENADRITNISCSQDYLLHVLMSPLVQSTIDSQRTVGAQPKLALTRIRKFSIPLPPTRAEQEAIAAILSGMDAEITALEDKLSKTRQLKQGMMQELLTGRIRLV